MSKPKVITTLFVDIGDVLLSNGWGHQFRRLAAEKFSLNKHEMEVLHKLIFVTYEEGKITLDEYLKRVVFNKQRDFTATQFRDFMFAQTTGHADMIELIKKLKEKYQLKIVAVNNEAKELNEARIKRFELNKFIDCFVSSCYVGLRKPDSGIFTLALNIAQVPAEEVFYIEDTQLFIDVAADAGIKGIRHNNYLSTAKALAGLGLTVD